MQESQISKINRYPWPNCWPHRTGVMGVINITPDSFSDGGDYLDLDNALKRADQLLNDGADLLDLGAQSTRPGAIEVGPEEELRRLIPVLSVIRKKYPNVLISVDTFHSKVAEYVIDLGANWINDISGGHRDPNLLRVVAEAGCPYVLMHSRGDSLSMDKLTVYSNLISDVREELLIRTELAIKKGISSSKIMWDPGIGFAKTTDQNLIILRNLEFFSKDNFPLIVGPSRKRFIGKVLNKPNPKERIWGTAAVVCRCTHANVAIVRVHDVKPAVELVKMSKVIW